MRPHLVLVMAMLLVVGGTASNSTASETGAIAADLRVPIHARNLETASLHGSAVISQFATGDSAAVSSNYMTHDRVTRFYPVSDNGIVGTGDSVLLPDQHVRLGEYTTATANIVASESAAITIHAAHFEANAEALALAAITPGGFAPSDSLDYRYSPIPHTYDLPDTAKDEAIAQADGVGAIRFHDASLVALYGWEGSIVHSEGEATIESGEVHRTTIPGVGRVIAVTYDVLKGSIDGQAFAENGARIGAVTSRLALDASGDLLAADATTQHVQHGMVQLPNGTWLIPGPVQLRVVKVGAEDGTITGVLSGNLNAAIVDGQPIRGPGVKAVTATTLTLAAALALVYKVAPYLSPLLTRLPPGKALENDNRKKLYTYICKKPGATFREVLRGTKIPAGTARHHLNVLARSDMIVERGHRSTLRYFENHGKFDGTWEDVVLLREPELKRVYAWVKEHPHAIQKELLEVAEGEWGWSRSTAQHRLARLVDGGLVAFHQAGRRKAYFIVDPAERQERRPGLGWMSASQ